MDLEEGLGITAHTLCSQETSYKGFCAVVLILKPFLMFTLFSSISRLEAAKGNYGERIIAGDSVHWWQQKEIRRQKCRGRSPRNRCSNSKDTSLGLFSAGQMALYNPSSIPREQRIITITHGDDSGHQENMNLCSRWKKKDECNNRKDL